RLGDRLFERLHLGRLLLRLVELLDLAVDALLEVVPRERLAATGALDGGEVDLAANLARAVGSRVYVHVVGAGEELRDLVRREGARRAHERGVAGLGERNDDVVGGCLARRPVVNVSEERRTGE